MFHKGISEDLKDCRAAMLHDGLDFSRLFVHVQYVVDIGKKRIFCEVRRPNHSYHTGHNSGGGRSTFIVHNQARFKKGHHSSGNPMSKSSASP